MRRVIVLTLTLAALLVPLGTVVSRAQNQAAWEIVYLFRDESVEASQAYQLASFKTTDSIDQQRPLQRFPIDKISVPWDVRPPSAISPDYKTLALIQWDEPQGRALAVDLASGAMRVLPAISVKSLFDTTLLGWTPDGAHLILYNGGVQGGQLQRYDLAADTLTTLFRLPDTLPIGDQTTLAPDASRVLYCAHKGNGGCDGYALRALDGGAAQAVGLPTGTTCPGYPALKWSADSRRIALDCVAGTQPTLTLIDAASGAVTAFPLRQEINDLAWAPDGSRLLLDLCAAVYVNADDADCGALQFIDPRTGRLTPGPAIERTEARKLFWLGTTLAFDETSASGLDPTLYFYDLTTQQAKQFSRKSTSYQDASISVLGARPLG